LTRLSGNVVMNDSGWVSVFCIPAMNCIYLRPFARTCISAFHCVLASLREPACTFALCEKHYNPCKSLPTCVPLYLYSAAPNCLTLRPLREIYFIRKLCLGFHYKHNVLHEKIIYRNSTPSVSLNCFCLNKNKIGFNTLLG